MIRWLINTILRFTDIGILEDLHMAKIFEQEHVQQLEQELQFIQLCIGRLTQNFNYYAHHEGNDPSYKALEDFRVQKIQLEVKLGTLNSFLAE